MRSIGKFLKSVPIYGWITGFVYFALQYGMYRLGNWLSQICGTTRWAFVPKIPAIDNLIPVIPVFIVIYIFSYVFWIGGPIIASTTDKKNYMNYMIGLSAAYIIGFLIFWFAPTYMDRSAEGLMVYAERPGIFNQMLASIYGADGGTLAFNLFPSYHCLISIYCYLGIRKREEVPKGLRIYSLVMAILICMSTVFTKQHYFIDIVGGLSISFACYSLVKRMDPASKILK